MFDYLKLNAIFIGSLGVTKIASKGTALVSSNEQYVRRDFISDDWLRHLTAQVKQMVEKAEVAADVSAGFQLYILYILASGFRRSGLASSLPQHFRARRLWYPRTNFRIFGWC